MDHATPNALPRDVEATSRFNAMLNFVETWPDNGWMVLKRAGLMLEFLPHLELNLLTS